MKVSSVLALVAAFSASVLAAPIEAVEDVQARDLKPKSADANLPGLNDVQTRYANAIINQAKKDGVGHRGCAAAIATGLVESSIIMYANNVVPDSLRYDHDRIGSDNDSIGIFQQRAGFYRNIWCDMNAACSANQFFADMKRVGGWQTMDIGALCQAIQRSEYPDRYANQVPFAERICSAGGL